MLQGKKAVSHADLRQVANEIGEVITDEEIQKMIDEADHSGTGVVRRLFVLILMMIDIPKPWPTASASFRVLQVGEDDFVKIVTSYAQHYDGEK